jgi:5-methylcytosine-specific restriction endonuclease McrA
MSKINKMPTNRIVFVRNGWFDKGPVKCHWCHRSLHNFKRRTDGGFCTIDHLVEQYLGGGDEIENLVPACLKCNSGRSSRPTEKGLGLKTRETLPQSKLGRPV